MAMIGLAFGKLLLIIVAVNGILTCVSTLRMLKAVGPEEYADSTDYSAAYEQPAHAAPKRRKVNRRLVKKLRKQSAAAAAEREQIDQILAKVSSQGMESLTWREKRALHKATEHQRQREREDQE